MRILCVSAERRINCNLTVGKEYEALELTDSGRKITLKDDTGEVHRYFSHLFEEADGKYVECVDNHNGSLNLTIGKIYPSIKNNRLNIVRVINDQGLAISYKSCRFKEVKSPSDVHEVNETVEEVDKRSLAVAVSFVNRVLRDVTEFNAGHVLALILSELNGNHGVGRDSNGTYLYFLNDVLRYHVDTKELTIKDVGGNSVKLSKDSVEIISVELRNTLIKELEEARQKEESILKSLNILNM